jgi:tetratricopeptide (TPR) repeat protein
MAADTHTHRWWLAARRWWAGRDRRALLLAAPALVGGAVVAAAAGACLTAPRGDVEARYLADGKAALQDKDHAAAQLCFERLVATSPGEPELVYRLALAAEARGDRRRAVELMRPLAPSTDKGYGPAQFWWARQLLLDPAPSRATAAAAEGHLVRALDGDLDDRPAAHALLGQLLLGQDRLDEAEYHLAKAVAAKPQVRMPLARLYARKKNHGRARQEAELAIRFFRDRAKADLDNHVARLTWADAVAFLEDYPVAVGILEDGLAATRQPVYRLALGRLYVSWVADRKRAGAGLGQTLALVDKGLTHDPANTDLLNLLLDHLRPTGAEADKARAVLRRLLASGEAPAAPVHFALAVDARLRGDPADERVHLELAHRLDPNTPRLANNLAWVLSRPPAPDLPRALALADLAVGRDPGNPNYRDTRARILLAMGRWTDALADLEVVLARAPDADGLHVALADAYDGLGQGSLAAEHRRLAQDKKPRDPRP